MHIERGSTFWENEATVKITIATAKCIISHKNHVVQAFNTCAQFYVLSSVSQQNDTSPGNMLFYYCVLPYVLTVKKALKPTAT
jgi:hypothetical protein